MSQPPPDELGQTAYRWLNDMGDDGYALVWVAQEEDLLGERRAPVVGRAGAEERDFDFRRLQLEEIARGGPRAALERWLKLDDGRRQLTIIHANPFELHEYTPGDLASTLFFSENGDRHESWLVDQLSSWFYRRFTDAPQGPQRAWAAAAAAWATHMRAFGTSPPGTVMARVLERAGEADEQGELARYLAETGLLAVTLFDGLQNPISRNQIVQDWLTLEPFATDIPVLKEASDWLLDQIVLRDATAQEMRARLTPDISDHLEDRSHFRSILPPHAPALDPQRTEMLRHTSDVVRAYTAAHYSGHTDQAQQLLAAVTGPSTPAPANGWAAEEWETRSPFERIAFRQLDHHYDDLPDLQARPAVRGTESLHATHAGLRARSAHLSVLHDTLDRLSMPPTDPAPLPESLTGLPAAHRLRGVLEAFGTVERARQFLAGRISYLQQEPVPHHRSAVTAREIERLQTAQQNLAALAPADGLVLDESHVQRLAALTRSAPDSAPAEIPARQQPEPGTEQSRHRAIVHPDQPGVSV
ncbi:hypothetical protein ABZW18_00490 [Streptomyces sp. NPDC004647]|uniref:hypothetical protein n=1 Tax=Streptomyces sp. NPDC004647 TaxID=3154671 RepID=UPI0033B6755A